ncbi:hypothetical protein BDP27DRAFT_1367049 [Rhodocollybia butyracea]|uniref:DUF6533 domain-containing protein n=1 Tax=Rhodocollybia butyracea TaxID=206335 RepID=A0A9P5PFE5_9AGAR|nr:hypothetical protein BDP27DRAFT_1367049 [Rhodocollybia butyracea]
MSGSSSDQAITEFEIIFFQLDNYTTLSSSVLFFYDFFLTLPSELRLIWSRRLTGSSVIFILSRYSLLLHQILFLAGNLALPGQTLTNTSCRDLILVGRVFSSTNDATMKLLSILRVYALFRQKRSLLILLCPFIIVDVISGILLIIFILTLVQTAHHIIESRKSGIYSIAEVVLCDGIDTAFGVASIYTSSNTWELVADTINPCLEVLSNILINRFVLNLRAFSNQTVQHSGKAPFDTTAPPLSTIDFAENRFLGNIGAPLDYNQWDNADELENEDEDIEWEIVDNMVDPLTTLVPVIYKEGPVRFVPMQREASRC